MSGRTRYMVEAKRESVEDRIYWLPLASFATLDKALSWCVGRNYNIQSTLVMINGSTSNMLI